MRRPARRIVAAVVGIWMVICAVAGARHEAHAAHWTDRAGRVLHAVHAASPAPVGAGATHAILQRAADAPDLDPCELAASRHAPASAAIAGPQLALLPHAVTATPALSATRRLAGHVVYRLAPKTSPPAA